MDFACIHWQEGSEKEKHKKVSFVAGDGCPIPVGLKLAGMKMDMLFSRRKENIYENNKIIIRNSHHFLSSFVRLVRQRPTNHTFQFVAGFGFALGWHCRRCGAKQLHCHNQWRRNMGVEQIFTGEFSPVFERRESEHRDSLRCTVVSGRVYFERMVQFPTNQPSIGSVGGGQCLLRLVSRLSIAVSGI